MFKLLTSAFLLFPIVLFAQVNKSCCSMSPTMQFAQLTKDEAFKAAHLEPVPFVFVAEKGKFVSFKTDDGAEGRAFEVNASKETNKYIFMIHEWWGLNEYIQQEAEKLQKELGDVNVLALDLYDKKIAITREDAGKYMGEVKEDRAKAIIRGAIKDVGPQAKIGTIGWCFGGGWSLQSSLLAGKQAAACVMYYGMPERDGAKLKALNAPVLGIFAKQDGWITTKIVQEFEAAMRKAQKRIIVKTYDADHAFANPSNPQFDKAATEDAHRHAVEFFKQNLLK